MYKEYLSYCCSIIIDYFKWHFFSAKCRTPEPVENAELKDKYKGLHKFKHGDKIEYDCKIGYTIAGSSRERVSNFIIRCKIL